METGQDSLTVALNIQALLMAEDFPGGIRIPASKMLVNPRGSPPTKRRGCWLHGSEADREAQYAPKVKWIRRDRARAGTA